MADSDLENMNNCDEKSRIVRANVKRCKSVKLGAPRELNYFIMEVVSFLFWTIFTCTVNNNRVSIKGPGIVVYSLYFYTMHIILNSSMFCPYQPQIVFFFTII